jgi:flagellar biosynthesis/type III secretory pathway M-ring protein FliF/YscJ
VIGAGSLIVLLVGAVIFLLLRRRRVVRVTDTAKAAIEGKRTDALSQNSVEQQISENDAQQARLESEMLNRIKLPANTKKTEVLVKHIRDSVQKDAMATTNVLRTWISEPDTKRTS